MYTDLWDDSICYGMVLIQAINQVPALFICFSLFLLLVSLVSYLLRTKKKNLCAGFQTFFMQFLNVLETGKSCQSGTRVC